MDPDQIFLWFFASSAVTSLLVLVAEAATAFFAPTERKDTDG
ncbi:hypothetical protein [Kitasatospora sp. NPDC098663]